MSHVLKSASKIVLLLFTLAVIGGLFIGRISADQFVNLATMVFMYYFTKRVEKPGEDIV